MGRLTFDVQMPRGRTRKDSDAHARVLVIADLSGSATQKDAEPASLADARLVRIDVESFDAVLRSLQPRVAVAGASAAGLDNPAQILTFTSLEDFHPDLLYDALDSIVQLRRTRERLSNPSTFAAEQARLIADATVIAAPANAAEDDASTLERLLGARPADRAAPAPTAGAPARALGSFDQMLRDLVAPHIVRGPGSEQAQLIASVDAAISDEMRRVLHAPDFQRIEATWRGLRGLVFENPLGPELEVYVLDASRAALVGDLRACAGEIERSQLYRLIVQSSAGPDATPFSLVIGDLSIAGSDEDVSLLAGLGAVAAQAGGCFLAAADPALWGASDLARQPERSAWSKPDASHTARLTLLRASAVAPFVGLCAPRTLGRVAYGPKTDPTDRFAFTELTADPAHTDFLWLNSAFACARLILGGVAEAGWGDGPGTLLDLVDLPHVMHHTAGTDALKACAEVFLDEASAQQILGLGVMPFMSYRNRNAVRLMRLQSIADPAAPLALRGGH
jgi:type VI secretion system protein ImpC